MSSVGYDALLVRLRDEADAKLPPFLQRTTKYHHYFSWMCNRIAGRFPELDVKQVDKLLLMDSSQLDMLLKDKETNAALLLDVAENGLSFDKFRQLQAGVPMHAASLAL